MDNIFGYSKPWQFFRFPEAPLRPEARGICHSCHMDNPALFSTVQGRWAWPKWPNGKYGHVSRDDDDVYYFILRRLPVYLSKKILMINILSSNCLLWKNSLFYLCANLYNMAIVSACIQRSRQLFTNRIFRVHPQRPVTSSLKGKFVFDNNLKWNYYMLELHGVFKALIIYQVTGYTRQLVRSHWLSLLAYSGWLGINTNVKPGSLSADWYTVTRLGVDSASAIYDWQYLRWSVRETDLVCTVVTWHLCSFGCRRKVDIRLTCVVGLHNCRR